MFITQKYLKSLILIVFLMSSCAVTKKALHPDYYNSKSKVGLILVTNEIGITQTGQRGLLDVALTQGNKFKDPLSLVDTMVNPQEQFEEFYTGLFESKGKNATIIAREFDETQFEKFIKPDKNKKYFKKDIRELRNKYQVDEIMIASITYGLNIEYYGMIEVKKTGYSQILTSIIDLNDNSLIYKSKSEGYAKLDKKWNKPPYEPLKNAIVLATQQSMEIEKSKY